MYSATIDEFIDTCESMKIYELEYASEGIGQVFSTIGKGIMSIIGWIKEMLNKFWNFIRGKKEIEIRKDELEFTRGTAEKISALTRVRNMIARNVEVRRDEAEIIDGLRVYLKNNRWNFSKPTAKAMSNYAQDIISIIGNDDEFVTVKTSDINKIIKEAKKIIDTCGEEDSNTVNYLNEMIVKLKDILVNNRHQVFKNLGIDRKKIISIETSPTGLKIVSLRIGSKYDNDDLKIVKIFSKTPEEKEELDDLYSNIMISRSESEYFESRHAFFNKLGLEDGYTIPTSTVIRGNPNMMEMMLIAPGKPVHVRPGSYFYHVSPYPNIKKLRPTYMTQPTPEKPVLMLFGSKRVYVAMNATAEEYTKWNKVKYGEYIYRFPADGYILRRDNEYTGMQAIGYVETDVPIPVERVN